MRSKLDFLAFVLLSGCGQVEAEPQIVGAGGHSGGAAGTGGAHSGGAGGSGGEVVWPVPAVPPGYPRPDWPSDVLVDDTPWGTNAFCSPYGGYLDTTGLVSTPDGVYASVYSSCSSAECSPDGVGYLSLYFNSGSGWQTVYGHLRGPPTYLGGVLPNGNLVSYSPCPAATVTPSGDITCLLDDGFGFKAAVHGDTIYSLRSRDQGSSQVFAEFRNGAWREIAEVNAFTGDFAIVGDSAYFPQIGEIVKVNLASGAVSNIEAPFRYFGELEALPDGLVLASEKDELTLWRNGVFSSVAFEHPSDVRLTTTPTGEIFATSGQRFSQVVGDVAVTLMEVDEDHYFERAVVASGGGLMLSIASVNLSDPCAALRFVWYDGAKFHPL